VNIEINKQARVVLAGALAGALLGALAALIYHQARRSPALAERAGMVAPKQISWPKVGGLALAVVRILREIMDLAKEG
jgi:hypothetical protein